MRDDRLLIATHNEGKAAEIAHLVDGLGYEVLSTIDLSPALPLPDEILETFAENALLKARYYHGLTGCLTLADDSGLVVDALDGAPGVRSARCAGPGASPGDLIATLLAQLAGVPLAERQARFTCAVAIAGPDFERVFEGTCDGTMTTEPCGSGGFGYDPVFLDPQTGRTFAEMTNAEKSARSHRGRALSLARNFLAELRNSA